MKRSCAAAYLTAVLLLGGCSSPEKQANDFRVGVDLNSGVKVDADVRGNSGVKVDADVGGNAVRAEVTTKP
jgi:hypothetical protein